MEVIVTKLTDRELMLEACESTFAGKSNQSLLSIYKSEHSPARTQMFWIKCKDIPLFVSTHLLRHHVGSQPYALTHRTDRKGGKDQGRETPTNLSILVNAQALIDMAKLRECFQASKETRAVFEAIKAAIRLKDPDLASMMVKKCVYRNGLCGEPKCCTYNKGLSFAFELEKYLKNF